MSPALAFETNPAPSGSRSSPEEKRHLDRLPSETLEAIFRHVGSDDLLSLSLACRSFHALAAARLYRHISHICGCQDPMADRLSLDWFTAKLQTLAASKYDYASFVRQISLERVNLTDVPRGEYRGEVRGENGDNEYTSGKYLNALLFLVLKRVTGLESFRWDIRVELNPWILEILSKISSLQSLHIRLPSSDIPQWSSYSASVPSPLPPNPTASPRDIVMAAVNHINSQPLVADPSSQTILPAASKEPELFKTFRRTTGFSFFSGIRCLSVLEIDDLGYIPELSKCISSSSSSIKSLKLSISDCLASKARPMGSADPDSISEVDQWGNYNHEIPLPPAPAIVDPAQAVPSTFSSSAPNALQAYRACVEQKTILARVFGLEEPLSQRHRDQVLDETILSKEEKAREGSKRPSRADEERNLVRLLWRTSRVLPGMVYCGSGSSRSLKALDLIEKATTKYLEQTSKHDSQAEGATTSPSATRSRNLDPATNLPKIGQASTSQFAAPATASTSTDQAPPEVHSVSSMSVMGQDQESLGDEDDCVNGVPIAGTDNTSDFEARDAQSTPRSLFNAKDPKGKSAVRDIKEVAVDTGATCKAIEDQTLEEYVRSMHGILLDSLSIHLIPVKATVLCRAVDVFALKHLSLLNVGRQCLLWAMLAQLHQARPLQLSSIHTDNVTASFLSFANGLDQITELFMFECGGMKRAESSAPKTTVKIGDIRRQILNKHIRSLRRLVIRNDEDSNWVLNSQASRLVARYGSNLIELAVGLDDSSYHRFMQDITGLRALKALQVLYHNPKASPMVLRELHKCILDHIVHFAHLRIEYVAMGYMAHGPVDNDVAHILYPSRLGLDICALERIVNADQAGTAGTKKSAVPLAFKGPASDLSLEELTADKNNVFGKGGRMNKVIKGLKLSDIAGIKMWEKDTWNMRL